MQFEVVVAILVVVIAIVVVSLINSSIHHSINNLFAISARVGRRPSAREFETRRLSRGINQFRRAPVTRATRVTQPQRKSREKDFEDY